MAPEQGRFLAWLAEALSVRNAIEVGVFTGYSSLAVAMVRPCSLTPGESLLQYDRCSTAAVML